MVGETVDNQVEALKPFEHVNGTSLEEMEVQLRVKYAVTNSFFVGLVQVSWNRLALLYYMSEKGLEMIYFGNFMS